MTTAPIDALSPVDGRYRSAAEPLRPIMSEQGLIRERIRIEAEWFLFLIAEVPAFRQLAPAGSVLERAAGLAANPDAAAPAAVKPPTPTQPHQSRRSRG